MGVDMHKCRLGLKFQHRAFYLCCREDAHAALQLYLLHIKNDPDLMTFEELVQFELSSMTLKSTPDANDDEDDE